MLERGGLDNWSFGGAAEVAPNVSVGGKVTYVVGKYNYERSYAERDTRDSYGTSAFPFNVTEITLDEFVESEISGVFGKFGLMANTSGILRVGLTATTPTWLSVRETFGTRGSSLFDDDASFTYALEGVGEYEVVTPWVFGAGAAIRRCRRRRQLAPQPREPVYSAALEVDGEERPRLEVVEARGELAHLLDRHDVARKQNDAGRPHMGEDLKLLGIDRWSGQADDQRRFVNPHPRPSFGASPRG